MRMLWLLLAVVALGGSASGQAPTDARSQPPVAVSAVTWGEHELAIRDRNNTGRPAPGFGLRAMSVTVTNTGSLPIESLRLAFVFSDPETGEEWFRYKVHSKKRLLPGESRLVEKAATATLGSPPRDGLAAKRAIITEVTYSDGSVWRRK